jgi:hypothetical protein
MVDGVGMLPFHDDVPGANHLHTEYGFRAVRWGDEPPTPPEVPNGDLLDEVRAINLKMDKLDRIIELLERDQPPEPPVVSPFKGEYFNNIALSGAPALVRDDEEINFFWGDGPPGPGIGADNFSVRWTKEQHFAEGTYTFSVLADDGVRLWVDDQLVIDKWVDQSPQRYDADVALAAGQHGIKLEYYERGGGSTIKLWWEP